MDGWGDGWEWTNGWERTVVGGDYEAREGIKRREGNRDSEEGREGIREGRWNKVGWRRGEGEMGWTAMEWGEKERERELYMGRMEERRYGVRERAMGW